MSDQISFNPAHIGAGGSSRSLKLVFPFEPLNHPKSINRFYNSIVLSLLSQATSSIRSGVDSHSKKKCSALCSPSYHPYGSIFGVLSFVPRPHDRLLIAGGDAIQAYGKGPGGVTYHGNVTDRGNGSYSVSAWPVVAGAYQMSVLVSALERSRWALGYRQDRYSNPSGTALPFLSQTTS